MNTKKNDQANQIKQAIAILRENNDKVTVKAVSDLTGIHIQTLYKHSAMRDLVRVHPKRHKSNEQSAAPLTAIHEKETVSHDVESYMTYIKDNYFSHAETFEDVISDMRSNTVDFKIDLFIHAKNKLLLSKELRNLAHSDNLFIADLKPSAPSGCVINSKASVCNTDVGCDELDKILRLAHSDNPFADIEDEVEDKNEYVIYNESAKQYEVILGSAKVDKRIEFILRDDNHILKIYKLVEVAQPVRKITRHKVN